jgi:hypothetical protein
MPSRGLRELLRNYIWHTSHDGGNPVITERATGNPHKICSLAPPAFSGALLVGYWYFNQEEVLWTGRKRFRLDSVPPETDVKIGR